MKEDRKMEEMTIIPAEAEHAELISVVQLPIIQEQLHTIKAQIEARAAAALAASVYRGDSQVGQGAAGRPAAGLCRAGETPQGGTGGRTKAL